MEDRQLLPPSWSDSVLHATLDMRLGSTAAFTYAKGWWTIPQQDVIMAVGYLQQIIMVLPKRDMVVVVTGKKPPRFGALIDLVEAASASTQPLPANPKATAELVRRVREVGSQARTPIEPPSELARRVSGRTYRFERNALGLNSLVLDLTAANAQYEMRFDATNPATGKLRLPDRSGLTAHFVPTRRATLRCSRRRRTGATPRRFSWFPSG